jgi:hypothetical protein
VTQHNFPFVDEQCNALRNATTLPYQDLLDGEMVRSAWAVEKLKFRERTYTPLVTLWTFLTQVLDADHSCRKAVSSLNAFLVSEGQSAVSPDTSNYCKARRRLPLSFIIRLVRKIAELLEENSTSAWLWKGRSVHMVDGSTASMPDTPDNQRVYPQPVSQKPSVGYPLARFVAIISLATGAVLDVALGPCLGKETGETGLLRSLVKRMKAGSIVLGDRSFGSYFGIAGLLEQEIDGVFRMHQRRKVDFRRGRCLGITDHIVIWQKPDQPRWMDDVTYAQMPDEMAVRELRFRVEQPGYRVNEIVLATTLLEIIDYSKEDLVDLFLKRWNIELDLRSIKNVMQMDVLRCKSPDLVDKEIWVHMLAYNIIRQLMVTAAAKNGVEPREISFKGTLQALTAFRDAMRMVDPKRQFELWEAMFMMIGHDLAWIPMQKKRANI